jgi:hypothetical protein
MFRNTLRLSRPFAAARQAQVSMTGTGLTNTTIRNKYTVVLVRHGESVWNNENKFTGWYDCPLSEKGHVEAAAAGELLKQNGFTFDLAFTSYLKRAIRTLWHVLESNDLMYIPIKNAWQLNERHYGGLQGIAYYTFCCIFYYDFLFVIDVCYPNV